MFKNITVKYALKGTSCEIHVHIKRKNVVKCVLRFVDKKLDVTIQGDADVAKAMEVSSADVGKRFKNHNLSTRLMLARKVNC